MLEFFNYLTESNAHGMKIAIGEFTKKELVLFLKSKKYGVSAVNRINRKQWAEKFLKEQELSKKTTYFYQPIRKVSDKEHLFHVSQFIDFTIPKHYNQIQLDLGRRDLAKDNIPYFYKENKGNTPKKTSPKEGNKNKCYTATQTDDQLTFLATDDWLLTMLEEKNSTLATHKQKKLVKGLYKEIYSKQLPISFETTINTLSKDEIRTIINQLYKEKEMLYGSQKRNL